MTTTVDLHFNGHFPIEHGYPASGFYRTTLCLHSMSCHCVSTCLPVRPSHAIIVSKWLKIGSRKQHHTIAQGL